MVMAPCLAMWENAGMVSQLGVTPGDPALSGHRSLRSRMEQLINCDKLQITMTNRAHFFPRNVTYYFVQTRVGKWAGKPYNWLAPLPKGWPGERAFYWSGQEACFYLGKFPIYWSEEYDSFLYADNMIPGKCYAVGKDPFVARVDMRLFLALDPDRRSIYFGPNVFQAYRRQMQEFKMWRERLERCKAQHYTPEPLRKRYVKGTKMEWPGSPMSEIPRPTPEEMKPDEDFPPKPPKIKPVKIKLHLQIALSQAYAPNKDKLMLEVNL